MDTVEAYCPASLSFIFNIIKNSNPLKTGSTGVGCTLDKGARVNVSHSSTNKVFFNGNLIQIPPVNYVLHKLALSKVLVRINSPLPLGFGFGISAASTLALAFALNKFFNLKKKKVTLAQISHVAEIKSWTGLGSVATQITGGFLVKKKAGIPVAANKLPLVGQKIYAIIVNKLETPSILRDNNNLQKINNNADLYLSKIRKEKNISLSQIIDYSYEFSQKTGIIQNKKVKEIIEHIRSNGGHACMAILGYVVITDKKPNIKQNYPIYELIITDKGIKNG